MENDDEQTTDKDKALLKRVEERYKRCLDHTKDWRTETAKSYSYVAGNQWTEDEKSTLEEQHRAPVVFNKSEVFVGAVTGLEALNRQEVKFLQRRQGQASAYELMNAAARYVNDDSDAEDHHSHAFRDLVVCGMGWTETYLQFDTNPDGDLRIERVDPLEMFWDERATQRCLSDARWVMRIKQDLSKEEIEDRWPDADIEPSDAFMHEPFISPHDATQAWKYRDDQARRQGKKGYTLVQYQWYEIEHVMRVATPGGMQTISQEEYNRLDNKPRAVKIPKRRYRQAFLSGRTVLEVEDLPTQQGFTLCCMTGKHDRNSNIWFGLMRSLFDPQDWTNKLFSQILHILNSNAKGGLLAERDAFEDIRQAEDSWARTDAITWARTGAIVAGKIQPKQPPNYPQGMDRLLQLAISMFPEVSGMNLELLGLAEKVQAGVLEAQRKQAGMTVLAWAFDGIRKYRKMHGRVLADYIRQYLSDGRLIRIGGQEQMQYIPLVRDELAIEYDMIVDEAPSSPNQKERVFAILTQLLPVLVDAGLPVIPEVLEYSPLPQTLVEKWKAAANQPNPQAQMMGQLQVADAQATVKEKDSKATLNLAKAQSEQIKAITG